MNRKLIPVALAATLLCAALPAPVFAGGDAEAGADVFDGECSDCHSLKAGKNKKGPSLAGVVGRHSGTIGDYQYSAAMAAANLTWTPDKLDAYIANPKQAVPGGKMKYDGLASAKDRADVIAFLATQK